MSFGLDSLQSKGGLVWFNFSTINAAQSYDDNDWHHKIQRIDTVAYPILLQQTSTGPRLLTSFSEPVATSLRSKQGKLALVLRIDRSRPLRSGLYLREAGRLRKLTKLSDLVGRVRIDTAEEARELAGLRTRRDLRLFFDREQWADPTFPRAFPPEKLWKRDSAFWIERTVVVPLPGGGNVPKIARERVSTSGAYAVESLRPIPGKDLSYESTYDTPYLSK